MTVLFFLFSAAAEKLAEKFKDIAAHIPYLRYVFPSWDNLIISHFVC